MVRKLLFVLTGFLMAVLIFGVAGFAYAQTQNPPDADFVCPFCGTGDGSASRGRRGAGMMTFTMEDEDGLMHDTMIAAMAEILKLTPEELEFRITAGETMRQIAADQGITADEYTTIMLEIRSTALEQGVATGMITQEQADWMLNHWNTMPSNGFDVGSGSGPCQGGTTGGGRGGRGGGRGSGN